MKIFRYTTYVVIATLLVGCMVNDVTMPDAAPPTSGKPTVPLKRRPIVPTTKLPRPRVVDTWFSGGSLSMVLASEVSEVCVVVTDRATGEVTRYHFEEREIVLCDVPEGEFEVAVEVDGEMETFVVE